MIDAAISLCAPRMHRVEESKYFGCSNFHGNIPIVTLDFFNVLIGHCHSSYIHTLHGPYITQHNYIFVGYTKG